MILHMIHVHNSCALPNNRVKEIIAHYISGQCIRCVSSPGEIIQHLERHSA
jgi:hypothetical protein